MNSTLEAEIFEIHAWFRSSCPFFIFAFLIFPTFIFPFFPIFASFAISRIRQFPLMIFYAKFCVVVATPVSLLPRHGCATQILRRMQSINVDCKVSSSRLFPFALCERLSAHRHFRAARRVETGAWKRFIVAEIMYCLLLLHETKHVCNLCVSSYARS